MAQVIPLNNEHHANIKIQDNTDFSRFKNEHLIPLTAHDFIPLASEFAIVFVKNEETGEFTATAMMGMKAGVNLYCQNKHWEVPVTPASFLSSPLSLHTQNDNKENCFVCIDIDSPLISEKMGQALFSNGEQTEYLQARTRHLVDVAEKFEQTKNIIQYLALKRLLTTKQLKINLSKGNQYAIDGLYVIDEKALNSLNDEDFSELRNKGLLPLIYAHLSSMHQVARLAKKQIEFDSIK